MNLSKTERLSLINQYLILEKLYPEEKEVYSLHRKILEEGYAQNYDELFECVSDEIPEEVTQEVWDILQMYRSLNFSFNNLKDKGDIDRDNLKFKGFDGNNETKYMVYAKFVLHNLDLYKELWDDNKYPDYNTHWPILAKYKRMVTVWKSISDRYNNDLTVDEIQSIIKA